jgi:hypothetical protein
MKGLVTSAACLMLILGCNKVEDINPLSFESKMIGQWYCVDSSESIVYAKWEFTNDSRLIKTDFNSNRIDSNTTFYFRDEIMTTHYPLSCFPVYYKLEKSKRRKYAVYSGMHHSYFPKESFIHFLVKEKPKTTN